MSEEKSTHTGRCFCGTVELCMPSSTPPPGMGLFGAADVTGHESTIGCVEVSGVSQGLGGIDPLGKLDIKPVPVAGKGSRSSEARFCYGNCSRCRQQKLNLQLRRPKER